MTDTPIRTVLRMRARAGREAEFEQAWLDAAAQISSAPGNIQQELSRDVDDQQDFVITSEWRDRASVDAFGSSPAREALTAGLRDLREGAARNTYELLRTVPAVRPLPIRVDLTTTVGRGEEEAFERAYEIVTARLVGTPGLIREELLREPGSREYHIFAEWETEQDFVNWVEDPSHAEQSGPLARWLSVSFGRRSYEIRFRPPQHVSTPGTVDFGTVARLSAAPVDAGEPDGSPTPSSTGSGTPPVTATTTEAAEPPARVAPPEGSASVTTNDSAQSEPVALSAVQVSPRVAPSQSQAVDIDGGVLVVGAGPVGLTAAIELARRGASVRIIDKRAQPAAQADKAIGVHCRTMEIWESQGVVGEAIDAGAWLHGQTVYVNGSQTHQVDWAGLPDLPYAHLGLPQYDTERILTRRLAQLGVQVERGTELVSFSQDTQTVTAELRADDGSIRTSRYSYLVGCDGGHSIIRERLGLTYEGGLAMFPELFMLGDVDLDWSMPAGHLLRFVRIEDDGDFTGMLVCVPLKGPGRYRVATLAPRDLQQTIGAGVVKPGFWQEYTPPTLADIQAVVDDLAPPGTTASNLRWSSIFRIKHGIVDRYRTARVFVAGDAAHLHPPAGGQGMNTGIQDAWNLGWKLALALQGKAAPGLLDSYHDERRPAGRAIVDRAVSLAFTDEMDMEDQQAQFLLDMQMTMNYAQSSLVGQDPSDAGWSGPLPGHRAPDAFGLTRFGVAHAFRLFELTNRGRGTLLLYADSSVSEGRLETVEKLAAAVRSHVRDEIDIYLIVSPEITIRAHVEVPVLVDSDGGYRAKYATDGLCAHLIRPDGHLGYRSSHPSMTNLLEHLQLTYANV